MADENVPAREEAQAREAAREAARGDQTHAGAENPHEAHKKELAKASEKIWKDGRKKIEGKIKDKKIGSRQKNYNFRLNRLTEDFLEPLDQKWVEYKTKKEAVLRSTAAPGEQIEKLSKLKDELNT